MWFLSMVLMIGATVVFASSDHHLLATMYAICTMCTIISDIFEKKGRISPFFYTNEITAIC